MKKKQYLLIAISICLLGIFIYLNKGTGDIANKTRVINKKNIDQGASNHDKDAIVFSQKDSEFVQFDPKQSMQLTNSEGVTSDTDVDGGFRVDDEGNLLIEYKNRLLFDYFLASIGAEDLEIIMARTALYIRENLKSPAREQAWDLFESYLAYKQALGNLSEHDGSIQGMFVSIKQDQELQISWLGVEASEVFFSEDNRYDDYAIGKLSIINNTSLSTSEKQYELEQLKESSDESLVSSIEKTHAPVRLHKEIEKLRESGASEYTIFKVREQSLGTEATLRLADLDKQRQEWERRFQVYSSSKEDVLHRQLSAELTKQEIDQLQKDMFNNQEIKRIQALERISSSGTTIKANSSVY